MSNKINLKYLKNKKIAILGLGIENYALVKYLFKKKVKCEITICDKKSGKEIKKNNPVARDDHSIIKWQLGRNYNKNLDKFDILFRSPGWPLFCEGIKKAARIKKNRSFVPSTAGLGMTKVCSPIKLFFELCPTKNIIGVTGTKGKGTTATLIYEILKMAGKRVWLGGNIGVAPFTFLDKIKKNDWVVLELSSFQLEDMAVSPQIAVITNFYKEHLKPADPHNPNYHRSIYDYWDAKSNIFNYQKVGDKLVIGYKLLVIKDVKNTKAKKIVFKKSNLPSKLIGGHNKENIAAAVEVAKIIGVKDKIIRKAVAKFKGLEHRLEFVRKIEGVKYYNDSFATTPESTIIALKSFNEPIILLAGGADKGAQFKNLAKEIRRRVKFVALLQGKATPRIKKELIKIKFPEDKIKMVFSTKEAVRQAKKNSVKGDVILLSPACASFGMFKNYKERGRLFKLLPQ